MKHFVFVANQSICLVAIFLLLVCVSHKACASICEGIYWPASAGLFYQPAQDAATAQAPNFPVWGKEISGNNINYSATSCGDLDTLINIYFYYKDQPNWQGNRHDFALWRTLGNLPPKNLGSPNCGCMVGNPINAAIGNKYQEELDIRLSKWLNITRYYNSSNYTTDGSFGKHWRMTYDRSLVSTVDDDSGVPGIVIIRPEGKEVAFKLIGGTYVPDPDIHDILRQNDNAQGQPQGWTFFDSGTQQFENYDTNGLLTSIRDLSGQVTTLAYSTAATPVSVAPAAGLLIAVTGPRGRKLQFVYNANSQITQITLPDGGTLEYGYDASRNLTKVIYPDGDVRTYIYNEPKFTSDADLPHALTGILDEDNQRFATYGYDSSGRAVSTTHAEGAGASTITYNQNSSATVRYPLGVSVTVSFKDLYGVYKPSSYSHPCGPSCGQSSASRTYDANGNPASSTDFNGITTAYTYDAAGLETQRIEAKGKPVQRTTNTKWDTLLRNPLERTVLNASGTVTAKTDWVYNPRGQVLARCEYDPAVSGATGYACSASGTPPAGVRRWTYTYCNAVGGQCPLIGLRRFVNGPRTDVADLTQYTYYPTTDESGCGKPGGACHRAGDLWKITNALKQVTTIASYDEDGRVTESIDPNGVRTDFTYTPRGWLHTRSVAGATTLIDYDAVGEVTEVIQPDKVFSTYAYDAAHRLIRIGDALGDHVDFTLDAAGNRIAEKTYAAGSSHPSRSLSRAYNALGELVKELDAYGHATTYAYDPDGNRTDTTDALGVRTHQGYDALSRLSQVVRNYLGTDAATGNTTTRYAYDSHDNVRQVTDPDGLDTSYYHDGLDDLGQMLSPDTGATRYTYDAAGNRTSRTDARGVITRYSYDALNRLTSIRYPNAALDVHLYYDRSGCKHSYPVGRLTAITDATGSTDYCYDARGNVTAKWQVTAAGTFITYYSWNPADRLQGIGYPDGASVTYRRDANGRVASVSAKPVGGMATPVLDGIRYLPFGPATQYRFDDGQVLDKTYDANYQATDIDSPWLNLHFQRDALGNLIAEGNAPGVPTPNETYRYDPLNRLQQVDAPNGAPWWTYTYDKTGDRLSKVIAGAGTDSYHYTPGTHHLTGISGAEVSQRAFDANGNTTALQAHGWTYGLGYNATNRLAVVQQNGTTVATYGVNGIGERVTKTLAGGTTHTYVHDEGGKLLEEYAAGHSRDYVWAGDTLVAILDNPAQGGDTIHYVYTDALGSPRAVTTRANKLVWDWPYRQNPFGEAPASGNGYTLNLRFPGQYHDQEDGLDYNVFRDYEPTTGRYIESDPLGLFGGPNTYSYTDADPLQLFDSLGLLPKNPLPGSPTPNTCLEKGETCVRRAQRGILTCVAKRGEVASMQCGLEWHAWAENCMETGGKRCGKHHPPGKPCGS